MPDLTKTTLYLPTAAYARLKAMAAREGRPAADLVREAVVEYTVGAGTGAFPGASGRAAAAGATCRRRRRTS